MHFQTRLVGGRGKKKRNFTFTLLFFHINHRYTYNCYLAWEIPWTEEPGKLQSMGSLRVRHDWATSLSLFTIVHWRRKWQPTPVFLPGEFQGREHGGLLSMGSHRVGHNWCDLAAAAVSFSFVTPWTVAREALCLWDSPGKNTGVGCHFLL